MGYNNFINIGSCGSKNYKIGELLKVGLAYEDFDVSKDLEKRKEMLDKSGQTPTLR